MLIYLINRNILFNYYIYFCVYNFIINNNINANDINQEMDSVEIDNSSFYVVTNKSEYNTINQKQTEDNVNDKGKSINKKDILKHDYSLQYTKYNIDNYYKSEGTVNENKLETQVEENLPLREILKKLMLPYLIDENHDTEDNKENLILKPNINLKEKPANFTPRDLSLYNSKVNSSNITESNSSSSNTSNSKQSNCISIEIRETIGDVEIINASALNKILVSDANITNRSVPAKCYLVYFFSPYCPFSARGSAYVNALARSLNDIPIYGLDSIEHHSVNARYGVMGTPSLILFHNGNVVAKYNASEYSTYHLESFIHYFTNQVIQNINVTSHDFKANIPSEVLPSTPIALYCAWLFLILCGCWLFLSSEFYAKLTEAIVNNWREAEAQHDHND